MTSLDPPIACTLDRDDLAARIEAITRLGEDALTGAELQGARALLRFTDEPGVGERLEAIAAAEAACCPFLDLEVARAEPAELHLRITGPEEAAPVVADLVAAFQGAAELPTLGRAGNC